MPTYDTPGPIDLTVSVVVADLTVRATDRGDTVVAVAPRDPADRDDVAVAERTRVEATDGGITIVGPRRLRRFAFTSDGGGVHVTVDVPTGSGLEATGQLLDVRTSGTLGRCRIRTTAGALDLEAVGPAELSTTSSIAVARIDGDAELRGTGRIGVDRAIGRVRVGNSNGTTVLGRVDGPVECRSANGEIRVGAPAGAVDVRTANGDVIVDGVASGEVAAETASGRIEIGLAEGTAAHLDVHTEFGRIDNRLDETDAPAEGDGTATVHARARFGDVVLRRSTGGTL